MNNNFQSLRIGLDYHGVINNHPQYFKAFCKEAIKRGHRIYILTGGPKHHIMRKLSAEKFNYTAIFAIIDYYKARQQIICPQYGSLYIEKRLWNTAKAIFCYQHHIDIQIDDSNIYGKYFITPYCKYKRMEKKCTLKSFVEVVDVLLLSPHKVLKRFEKIFSNQKYKYLQRLNQQHIGHNNDNPN